MLEVRQLSKTYGKRSAVKNLNFKIEKGSFIALLGKNGAGKSTTLQMLMGLLKPTTGKIIYPSSLNIGVVFQESVLDDVLTVRENLKLRQQQKENADLENLLQQLGLIEFVDQPYGTLSGGQKRRVDIARALLNKTELLFLDEPTTGLDIQTRVAIWQFLKELREKYQLTIIVTTHYLDEVESADEVLVIHEGELVAQGSAQEIKATYAPAQLLLEVSNPIKVGDFLQHKGFDYSENGSTVKIGNPTIQQVMEILADMREDILDFDYRKGNMDEAFLALTGKEMK